ncbi:hypothetical protein DFH07DRAFT_1055458 [Mycena maculata]|uniref:Uncharacterized protein n=1 Tax=Mycena maculata TaxID=230809 RepID=A0AAD7KB24_9AGAR|nr:hypothetical protein DFH07DRAFT_1055458 [Mycena maculata]
MNVASLLQDSPSDRRERPAKTDPSNSSSASGSSGPLRWPQSQNQSQAPQSQSQSQSQSQGKPPQQQQGQQAWPTQPGYAHAHPHGHVPPGFRDNREREREREAYPARPSSGQPPPPHPGVYRGGPPPHYPSPPPGSAGGQGERAGDARGQGYSDPSPMYAPMAMPMGALRQPGPGPPPPPGREYAYPPHPREQSHPSLGWPPPPQSQQSQAQSQSQQQQGPQSQSQQQGGVGSQGQRTFQGQFHTSFVPVREASPGPGPPPSHPSHRKSASNPNVPGNPNSARRLDAWEEWEHGAPPHHGHPQAYAPGRDPQGRELRDGRDARELGRDGREVLGRDVGMGMALGREAAKDTGPPERVFRARAEVRLGTWVWPASPFPHFFADGESPASSSAGTTTKAEAPANKPVSPTTGAPADAVDGKGTDDELLALDTRVTLLLPAAHLPAGRPTAAPRVWGGGLPGAGVGLADRPPHAHPYPAGHGPPPASHPSHPSHSHHSHAHAHSQSQSQFHSHVNANQPPERRRLYTDDSEPLGAAVHAGRVRWSQVARARREGRDVGLDLRVVRVLGASGTVTRGWGGGGGREVRGRKEGMKDALKDAGKDAKDLKEKEAGKEGGKDTAGAGATEAIGRFVGGWGARCGRTWGELLAANPAASPSPSPFKDKEVTLDADEVPIKLENGYHALAREDEGDDPTDDGRSLLSGGWGAGHDGSAFEVVRVWVGEKNAAHALTRSNRAQRLAEYSARRAALLSLSPSSASYFSTPRGRKRRRAPSSPPPASANGTALRAIDEDDSMDGCRKREWEREREEGADRELVRGRTVLCGFGGAGKLGFKYDEDGGAVVRGVLFPPPAPAVVEAATGEEADERGEDGEGGEEEEERARKRRRVSGLEEVIAAAAMEVDQEAEGVDVPAGTNAGEGEDALVGSLVDPGGEQEAEKGEGEEDKDGKEEVDATPTKRTGDVDADADATPKKSDPSKAAPVEQSSTKPKEKEKRRDVLLETAEGVLVFSPAEGSGEDGESEEGRWDVWSAEAEKQTLLHRALGAGEVEFGAEGVRFRAAPPSAPVDAGKEGGETEEGDKMDSGAGAPEEKGKDAEGWGPRVGVVLWRYA